MNARRIMAAFPPTPDEQVTLANWRQHPFSEWAFHNVRELLPTASIPGTAADPAPQSLAQTYLEDVSFANPRGEKVGFVEALRTSHTDGIVVSYRGQTVFEWYAQGLTPDTPHLIFSVSKSIAGTLGGILVDRGILDPDAQVTRYIPEMEGSAYGSGCTVRHLLDMSVGIRFDEDYMARDGDVVNYRRSTGWEAPDAPFPRRTCAIFCGRFVPMAPYTGTPSITSRPIPTCLVGCTSGPVACPMPKSSPIIYGSRWAPSTTPISPWIVVVRRESRAVSARRCAISPGSAR